MNIRVIGIGQSMRGDDAAGLEAIRRWQIKYPGTASDPRLSVENSELPGLSLLDMLGGADAAILVDAVHSSSKPGTLHLLRPDDLAAFSTEAGSAHGWGVAESLNLGRILSPSMASCRITLIGIEAGRIDLGTGLSPEVEAALKDVVDRIEKEVIAQM